MVLLMLLVSPLRDWIIDGYIGVLERRLDRVTERMENASVNEFPMPE